MWASIKAASRHLCLMSRLYLVVGADNVIAVKVNNAFNVSIPPLTADFTFFGGIYRDVHLLVTKIRVLMISPLDYGSPGIYLKNNRGKFRFRESSSDSGCFATPQQRRNL